MAVQLPFCNESQNCTNRGCIRLEGNGRRNIDLVQIIQKIRCDNNSTRSFAFGGIYFHLRLSPIEGLLPI